MPFLNEAKRRLAELDAGGDEHRILNYLIQNAQGSANARSWPVIFAEVAPSMTKEAFQQGLLSHSRSSSYFIGSCFSGYFIMLTQDDVNVTGEFLAQRIRQITRHHEQLGIAARNHRLNPPPSI